MDLLHEKFVCYFFNSLDPKKKNDIDSIEGIKEIELFEVDFPGRIDDIKDAKVKQERKPGLSFKSEPRERSTDSGLQAKKKATGARNKSPNPFDSLFSRGGGKN